MSAWSAEWVPGQPGLRRETLSQKQPTNQPNNNNKMLPNPRAGLTKGISTQSSGAGADIFGLDLCPLSSFSISSYHSDLFWIDLIFLMILFFLIWDEVLHDQNKDCLLWEGSWDHMVRMFIDTGVSLSSVDSGQTLGSIPCLGQALRYKGNKMEVRPEGLVTYKQALWVFSLHSSKGLCPWGSGLTQYDILTNSGFSLLRYFYHQPECVLRYRFGSQCWNTCVGRICDSSCDICRLLRESECREVNCTLITTFICLSTIKPLSNCYSIEALNLGKLNLYSWSPVPHVWLQNKVTLNGNI